MPLVRVPDRDTGGWEIEAAAGWGPNMDGEIGRVSTQYGAPGQRRRDPRIRWGVNVVWRLESGKYAVLRGSYSRVYHTDPTDCRTITQAYSGLPATVAEMKKELILLDSVAEPCADCLPPVLADLLAGDKIRYEFPRQSVDTCDTSAQVIEQLTRHRKHSGARQITVSEPVKDLLEQLRANDPAFRGRSLPMQRIG